MRSGWNATADLKYYIRPLWGVGLKYALFHASATEGSLWDTNYINFIGPMFCGKTRPFGISDNWIFTYSGSIGYIYYWDKGQANLPGSSETFQGIITAESIGIYFEAGLEVRLMSKLFLTCKAHLQAGAANTYTARTTAFPYYQTVDPENGMNLSHLGVSAGLKLGL